MSDNNPFQTTAGTGHMPPGRTVDAGRGIEWLRRGWQLFVNTPGVWLAIAVILLVLLAVLSVIPLLGQIAVLVAIPIIGGGLVLGCKSLSEGGQLRIEHLFEGLQQHGGPLALVGVFYAIGGLLVAGIVIAIGGGAAVGGAFTQGWPGAGMAAGGLLLAMLVWLVLSVLLGMAFWFAPALVVLRGVAPFDAMKASIGACLQSLPAFLVFGLLVAIIAFFAMLPMGLGMLVFIPVLTGAMYASYADVFA